jgi:NAD/NADP transhydrogenase alpha subunit
MKVIGGVMIRRIIAATYMTALSAQAQVNPLAAHLEALLAAARAGGNLSN